MKTSSIILFLFLSSSFLLLLSCEKNEQFSDSTYACSLPIVDSSAAHPKANAYQNLLQKHRRNGLVGAVLLVKDKDGLWMGADGQADIASQVPLQVCNTFLIASISKVFTSAAVYRYIDQGLLSLEDPIAQWLDESIVNKVANAKEAKIKHLLAHTSGIADYYTFQFELDQINRIDNKWQKEDVLKYVYGKPATHTLGADYSYSNTNFLLLSIILEKLSGKTFEQVYQQEVFTPLSLSSAYYSEERPIPTGCVKGYVDVYGKDRYIESASLYEDELAIGGDGGIAINAYDLAVFFESLMKGHLISTASLNALTNWFPISQYAPDDALGQTENGYGLEKFNTIHGYAVGHTGGISGFSTLAAYFPEKDRTYILLVNSAGNETGSLSQEALFEEVTQLMFE